jgi:hypothetical protein
MGSIMDPEIMLCCQSSTTRNNLELKTSNNIWIYHSEQVASQHEMLQIAMKQNT